MHAEICLLRWHYTVSLCEIQMCCCFIGIYLVSVKKKNHVHFHVDRRICSSTTFSVIYTCFLGYFFWVVKNGEHVWHCQWCRSITAEGLEVPIHVSHILYQFTDLQKGNSKWKKFCSQWEVVFEGFPGNISNSVRGSSSFWCSICTLGAFSQVAIRFDPVQVNPEYDAQIWGKIGLNPRASGALLTILVGTISIHWKISIFLSTCLLKISYCILLAQT